jgi:DNA-binding transcriptional regulator YiaG
MANYTQAFREEVMRLARKEVKSQTDALKRASSQYRRDVASLKREVSELSRKVAFLERQESKRVSQPEEAQDPEQVRFSPRWLHSHREKLGLSAADYGKLIGVTGQSIYMWERGQTKPRKSQLAKLAGIRGIGKREALKRLELLEG